MNQQTSEAIKRVNALVDSIVKVTKARKRNRDKCNIGKAWSEEARQAAAEARRARGGQGGPRPRDLAQRGVHDARGHINMKVGQDIDFYHPKTGDKQYGRITQLGGSAKEPTMGVRDHNTGERHSFALLH
jgi:hypothetical protein